MSLENMGKTRKMSETTYVMIFLTLSGGLQDAYSYFVRGQVFANAQTGNIVLMAMDFLSGHFHHAPSYLFPIVAFGIGILVSEQAQGRLTGERRMHWRQMVLLFEILILAVVGLIPVSETWNPFANALTSFVCAMQVQGFRSVNGHTYASTMCIGNIRSGMAAFSAYLRLKDIRLLRKSLQYLFVIFIFFLGAGVGSGLSLLEGITRGHIIFVSCFFLLIGFLLMRKEEREEG